MTTAAKTTFGTKLFLAAAPTAPTTLLPELLSLTPPAAARDMIDVTTHDSPAGAEEVIVEGTYNPGEISGQMHYIAGAAGDVLMLGAVTAGTLMNFKVQVKGATGTFDRTGSGYVTEYSIDDMPVKGKQAASFTIKVTGAVTQAATA